MLYINIIKTNKRPTLIKAGIDLISSVKIVKNKQKIKYKTNLILFKKRLYIAKANKSVLIPRAPFTNRSTRPTLTTLTTLRIVGEKVKVCFINFSKLIPKI